MLINAPLTRRVDVTCKSRGDLGLYEFYSIPYSTSYHYFFAYIRHELSLPITNLIMISHKAKCTIGILDGHSCFNLDISSH